MFGKKYSPEQLITVIENRYLEVGELVKFV